MKNFSDQDFLLQTDMARELYHEHMAKMPIVDYHCHLDPRQIAENHQLEDLTEMWLGGDHYEWRVTRVNGIPKEYITGNKPFYEKLLKWAETVPYTMRNPLYHWTRLELNHISGIHKVLNPTSAEEIYATCTDRLRAPEYCARAIMKRMNVETVCTTDDPIDSLEFHQKIRSSGCHARVYPAWQPDKILAIDNFGALNDYLPRLETAADRTILTYEHLLEALQRRHDFSVAQGCRLSDHGLGTFYAEPYTEQEIEVTFLKARMGRPFTEQKVRKYRSTLLYKLVAMDARNGWVQQFHTGTNRNNNKRMFKLLGPDTDFDAIDDQPVVVSMNRFFSHLNQEGLLAKTIVYNLNPRDTELMVASAYNLSDGGVPGRMQYGMAWWFLDQIKDMEDQLNTLSSLGFLSRSVGMLTDSRSFLSYPRHEYFRQIPCNMLGNEMEKGLLPTSELSFVGWMVEDVSYSNAK